MRCYECGAVAPTAARSADADGGLIERQLESALLTSRGGDGNAYLKWTNRRDTGQRRRRDDDALVCRRNHIRVRVQDGSSLGTEAGHGYTGSNKTLHGGYSRSGPLSLSTGDEASHSARTSGWRAWGQAPKEAAHRRRGADPRLRAWTGNAVEMTHTGTQGPKRWAEAGRSLCARHWSSRHQGGVDRRNFTLAVASHAKPSTRAPL